MAIFPRIFGYRKGLDSIYPPPRLLLEEAQNRHTLTYTAFAEQSKEYLTTQYLGEGLSHLLNGRLGLRPRSDCYDFTCVVEPPTPVLLNYFSAVVPVPETTTKVVMDQAIVYLKTNQTLRKGRFDNRGEANYDSSKTFVKEANNKVKEEFIVMQRKWLDGKSQPWKMWGFIPEETYETYRVAHRWDFDGSNERAAQEEQAKKRFEGSNIQVS